MFASVFHYDPEFKGRRVVTFHNQRDYIFFRHHRYFTIRNSMQMTLFFVFQRYEFRNNTKVAIQEIGPRFTLKLRSLQKGTFDSKFGEYEWALKVFITTIYSHSIISYDLYRDTTREQTEEDSPSNCIHRILDDMLGYVMICIYDDILDKLKTIYV